MRLLRIPEASRHLDLGTFRLDVRRDWPRDWLAVGGESRELADHEALEYLAERLQRVGIERDGVGHDSQALVRQAQDKRTR